MGLYVIPRRVAWFDTVVGRGDALATMSLMQIIADAYDDANSDMWVHDDEPRPSSSSPNEAQEAVRDWLAYAHFLPPFPRKQLPAVHQLSMLSSSIVSNPPKITSKKWRLSVSSLKRPRKTHSTSTNSLSPSRSLLSLSPLKLWRRRRESVTSFTTVSELSTLSTPPSTPSSSNLSSRSLPITFCTTPTYKKRPRFPTKIPYRQGNTFDNAQVSPSRNPPPNTQQSVFPLPSDIPTRRSTPTLSFDSTTSTTPWLTRSLSYPSLRSSCSSFESPLWSARKAPVLDKITLEDRPYITLSTLVVITILGYIFFFFLFLGCFLIAVCRLFEIVRGTADE